MKRTGWIIAAAALQLLVLVYMAGEREVILRSGRTVYLRTAPVDPRDPFRGDYVTLDYEISRIPTNLCQVTLPPQRSRRGGTRVYARLQMDGDLATVAALTERKPAGGLFIRGQTDPQRRTSAALGVRYGIEAFFVQQGRGRDLERRRVDGDVQVPLEMQVALGHSGTAVIKGYRWSPLGIGLQATTVTNRNDRNLVERHVTQVALLLQNASDKDLAIVDQPGYANLTLDPDLRWWADSPWTWVGAQRPAPQAKPTDADVHILKPGERYRLTVDLGDPAWFVTKDHEPPRTLTGLNDWSARFRLVYRPPFAEDCRHLTHAALIWHGNLPSRSFNGGGQVD